jgi:Flp pilus assembly protein TadD
VKKVPISSDLQFLLGETLIANHRTVEAQQALEKAVELDKFNVQAFFLLAQLQEAAGHPDDAISILERSIHDNPQDVRPCLNLGAFEERRGDWQKAQDLYKKALQIQPNQPTAANNLSYLLLEHGGDLGYAVSLAQTARAGMPDSANAADTLGWAHYKLGSYDSAIRLFQEAARKTPQNAIYQYHLGLAYAKANKVELARASFQRALKLDPNSSRVNDIRQALAALRAAP